MVEQAIKTVYDKVLALIAGGRMLGFTEAASNLEHYLKGRGALRVMPAQAFLSEPFFLEHLRRGHVPRVLGEAQSRLAGGGISSRPLQVHCSTSAMAPHGSKLFYALGGFQVLSKVELAVSRIGGDPRGRLCEVTSWHVECKDQYNWDPGKSTNIPGVGVIRDDEIRLLEQAGLARPFPVRSEVMDLKRGLQTWWPDGARGFSFNV